MEPGDLILAYQTDLGAAVGVCRLKRFIDRSGEREVVLKREQVFQEPVKIRPLKKRDPRIARMDAFRQGPVQMLYETSSAEARTLLRACGAQRKYGVGPAPSGDGVKGGGFGSSEANKAVERAAVSKVRRWYRSRGWAVRSVEKEKPGYELTCSKVGREEHVEVKGVSGELESFAITAAEVRQARQDSRFVLRVVTRARSRGSQMFRWRGREFLKAFELEPLQYLARRT